MGKAFDGVSRASVMDALLIWNRRQDKPPITVGHEYGVAEAVLDLVGAELNGQQLAPPHQLQFQKLVDGLLAKGDWPTLQILKNDGATPWAMKILDEALSKAPDYPDGHDHEGFPGGCERMGCSSICEQSPGAEGELPKGWKLVEKPTCFALMNGREVIATLAGPDAESNAAKIAHALTRPTQIEQPVAVVEFSDFQSASAIAGEEPRKIAVRALFEGALRVGDTLYNAPIAQTGQPVAETLASHAIGEIGYCKFLHAIPFGTKLYAAPIAQTPADQPSDCEWCAGARHDYYGEKCQHCAAPADGLVEAAESVMRAAKWWKENTDSPKSALIHFARASDALGGALAAHRAGGVK